jgi:Fur family peroxide stress response transcriptional regulator
MRLSVSSITEQFKRAGRKVTPQRVAIFEVLCRRGGHPTVDQIYRAVRKRFPMISLNTVYQTMEALVELKVVSPVGAALEATRYETDPEPHHHAVCMACKQILDVFDPSLEQVRLPRGMKGRFVAVSHTVEFLGYCADCRASAAARRP